MGYTRQDVWSHFMFFFFIILLLYPSATVVLPQNLLWIKTFWMYLSFNLVTEFTVKFCRIVQHRLSRLHELWSWVRGALCLHSRGWRFMAAAIPFHPIQVIPTLHQRPHHSLATDDFLGGGIWSQIIILRHSLFISSLSLPSFVEQGDNKTSPTSLSQGSDSRLEEIVLMM